ncbi:MAG: M28 family peptidase [Chloroflexi bacterium]|nr:M28 family peptidase [Chloroflexota bacterium]
MTFPPKTKPTRILIIIGTVTITLITLLTSEYLINTASNHPESSATGQLFSGDSAMTYAQAQCDIGPRPTGATANKATANYIINILRQTGWPSESQEFQYRDKPIQNVIGKRGKGSLVIIGAHYDTRPRADNDPNNPQLPIIGANDGASGTAILLELARVLPTSLSREVWLAFLDAEDWGNIDGWPFSVGAEHLAASLKRKPDSIVILDMVGDRDQQIYFEANSNLPLQTTLFSIAAHLGYSANFVPRIKYAMTDDHTPFLTRGITAVDLIDFDYPYWHTLQDTCDKIDARSLERVGRVIQQWLLEP